jgi:hypothetical protein
MRRRRRRRRRRKHRPLLEVWGPTQRIPDQGEIPQSCLNGCTVTLLHPDSLLFQLPGDSRVVGVTAQEPWLVEGIHDVTHVAQVGEAIPIREMSERSLSGTTGRRREEEKEEERRNKEEG